MDYSVILKWAGSLTLLFLLLRPLGRTREGWRTAEKVFLVLWCCIVLILTLFYRSPTAERLLPSLIPFHSYQGKIGGHGLLFRLNFMNVLLFYPGGAFGASLLFRRKKHFLLLVLYWLFLVLVSAAVETLQYLFSIGQADIDDLIHNAIGAFFGIAAVFLGYSVEKLFGKLFRKRKKS